MSDLPDPNFWPDNQPTGEMTANGDIYLGLVPLDHPAERIKTMGTILHRTEHDRALRLASKRLTDRYIAARYWLRIALSRLLECEPDALRFTVDENGKPILEDEELHFNLSHSAGYAVLAVSRKHPVGVDIEVVRDNIRPLQIARRFFSVDEKRRLAAYSGNELMNAFFECWTRKEAYCKATGLGLRQPLDQFSVSFGKDESCRFVKIEEDGWQLHDLPLGKHWRGALSYRGTRKNLYCQSPESSW